MLAGTFVYCCATRKHFYNNAASTFVNLHTKENFHSYLPRSDTRESKDKIIVPRHVNLLTALFMKEKHKGCMREWLEATGGL